MQTAPVLVLGVGNALMRDEGIGPRVAAELREHFSIPETIELVDAGTLGLGMMHLFRDRQYVLVVDAVNGTGHPAGTVVRLAPEDFAPNQVLHSLHDMRLVDVLQAAELIGVKAATECIGVQVQSISQGEFSVGLTEPVESAIPRAVAAMLFVLSERGVHLEPRRGMEHAPFADAVAAALADIRSKQTRQA